ncbi:MAG: YihY family inner membrane protein [Rhodospirillales bacterium]|jgi:membrane protein|nr:YihY family inner membrane protein [Rhodospirillales bacterium]
MRLADVDVVEKAREIRAFLGFAMSRFQEDRGLRMAASLSYTSLLAVVPLSAIAFSMLAAFPVFEGIREEFQGALFSNFLPQSAEAMREYFDQFIKNTAGLTAVGIIGLAATAVLLLGTIEADLNAIFRVARARAMVPRLLVFWALLTLGPLLLGASFSLSTYFFALTRWAGVDGVQSTLVNFTQFLPTLMVIVALTLCYIIVPNRRINSLNALIGGIIAGLLFAMLRKGFGIYVTKFPTYQTIYGAVSVVPIFLVWMYMSWAVVIFGAVITASLGEWRAGIRERNKTLAPEERLIAALQILDCLFIGSRNGKGTSRAAIMKETALGGKVVDDTLVMLEKSGFTDQTTKRGWVLVRDLVTVSLYDLMRLLGLAIEPGGRGVRGAAWQPRLAGRLVDLAELQKNAASLSLRDLLSSESETTEHTSDARKTA